MCGKIALIGPMGAGKSSIASPLAAALGWQHIDIDSLVVKNQGKSISQIFQERGEAQFRLYESDALKNVIESNNNIIIATGGGIVTQKINLTMLAKIWVVYLRCNLDTLYNRVKFDDSRPLLQTENLYETLKEIVEERESLYNQCANQIIHTDQMSIPQIVHHIQTSIHE